MIRTAARTTTAKPITATVSTSFHVGIDWESGLVIARASAGRCRHLRTGARQRNRIAPVTASATAPGRFDGQQVAGVRDGDDFPATLARYGRRDDAVIRAVHPGDRARHLSDARRKVGRSDDLVVGPYDVIRCNHAGGHEPPPHRRFHPRRKSVLGQPFRRACRVVAQQPTQPLMDRQSRRRPHQHQGPYFVGPREGRFDGDQRPQRMPDQHRRARGTAPRPAPRRRRGTAQSTGRAFRRGRSPRARWRRAREDRWRRRGRRGPPGPAPSSKSRTTRRRRESATPKAGPPVARRARRSEFARRGPTASTALSSTALAHLPPGRPAPR